MKLGTTFGFLALGLMASAALAQNNGGSLPSTQGDNIAGGGAAGNMTVDRNAGGASNATTGSYNANGTPGSYGTNRSYNGTTRLDRDLPRCSARIRDNCMEV